MYWIHKLLLLYPDPSQAARWLTLPNVRFGGLSAVQMIRAHRQKEVAQVVDQLAVVAGGSPVFI